MQPPGPGTRRDQQDGVAAGLFYGLLTWMPNYLSKVHGFDIKQMGGAVFIMFFSGFVGEMFGGWLADK